MAKVFILSECLYYNIIQTFKIFRIIEKIMSNLSSEQKAREIIDKKLLDSGWLVQDNKKLNFNEGLGVRDYQTDSGPADYVLFIDRKPVGVIEAKK
jgi:type I site-specific restriction endonuclease